MTDDLDQSTKDPLGTVLFPLGPLLLQRSFLVLAYLYFPQQEFTFGFHEK